MNSRMRLREIENDDTIIKMPEINVGKNNTHYAKSQKNRIKQLNNIRNIYLKNDPTPPLFVKFERFGKNFD